MSKLDMLVRAYSSIPHKAEEFKPSQYNETLSQEKKEIVIS